MNGVQRCVRFGVNISILTADVEEMALFRKPKKNIRRRNFNDEEDEANSDENNSNFVENSLTVKPLKEKKKEKVRSIPGPVLSFRDEEEEDCEVFQVKKSSHSKKLVKQLDRERKKKKNKVEAMDVEEEISRSQVIDDDDIVVVLKTKEEEKLKQAEKQKKDSMIVLNGRAALAAGKDDMSSSDDDEGSTKHKFLQPNHSAIRIESGIIPDAATIHAARKRRQRARQLGSDFIPVENNTKLEQQRSGQSRLVRDDDEHDCSEDEDDNRIDMTVNLEAKARDDRRQNFCDEESAVPEEEEWESQQIRKGVTGAGVPGACSLPLSTAPLRPSLLPDTVQPPSKELESPQVLVQNLKARLAELKELHKQHVSDRARGVELLEECSKETEELEKEAPGLADKFRVYQDLRGYVTDLVECLDEKMPGLVKLEAKCHELWAERCDLFVERRRQDVRDQADEMSPFQKKAAGGGPRWSREEEEVRSRRAAEREGRRTRRRRARELRTIPVTHVEGMSSDEELTELEATAYKQRLDEVARLRQVLLEDVIDDFGTVNGIASRMEAWRTFDMTAYSEAYVSLCLPKIFGPVVRLHLLAWNPLQRDAVDVESQEWWGRLLCYGVERKETLKELSSDPDVLLVPLVVERVIIPKITQLVETSWDPLSSSQTLRLVSIVAKYVNDYPTLGHRSRHIEALLKAVVDKLKAAVDNDVFIPISVKASPEVKSSSTIFFQRQFASAVKLLRNILSFEGLVGSVILQEVALDSLLNRYLVAALRTCSPCEAIAKANMVMSTFPRWWFQTETKMPRLEMLCRYLRYLSSQVAEFDSTEKESFELVNSLLRTLELSCSSS